MLIFLIKGWFYEIFVHDLFFSPHIVLYLSLCFSVCLLFLGSMGGGVHGEVNDSITACRWRSALTFYLTHQTQELVPELLKLLSITLWWFTFRLKTCSHVRLIDYFNPNINMWYWGLYNIFCFRVGCFSFLSLLFHNVLATWEKCNDGTKSFVNVNNKTVLRKNRIMQQHFILICIFLLVVRNVENIWRFC